MFNTTFVIEDDEIEWWRDWMCRYYLPTFHDVMPNITNEVYRLENEAQTAGSTTFSCQWRCQTLAELDTINKYSAALHEKLAQSKGTKCLFFSTMMKKIEL